MFRRRHVTLALLAALALPLVAAGAGVRIGRVAGGDMEPSLRPGDWVLWGPARVGPGDVVVLSDPLDPDRWVARRALGLAGQRVAFSGHYARVDDQPVKQVLMGDWGGEAAVMEQGTWLVAFSNDASHLRLEPVEVPAGALFVAADRRDLALDSRWWGPVPERAVRGVVLLRLGAPDAWRAPWSLGRQTVRPEIPAIPYTPPSRSAPAPRRARAGAG
jgi:signal peptidase I